ncbi:MAG TPA: hypothetical protein PKL37_15390, partial [Panacibacter sp.]|nr:hypothetical protein [Panacibacter sp.]
AGAQQNFKPGLARRRQSFPGYCFSEVIDLFCLADGKVGQLVIKPNCTSFNENRSTLYFLTYSLTIRVYLSKTN